MNDYFEDLIGYYNEISFEELNQEAVHQIKRCLLDFTGCGLVASHTESQSPFIHFLLELDNGQRDALLWGTNRYLSAPLAAFANSTTAATLELDDATSIGASVHPGVSVIPAAIAAAQRYGATGKEFLKAVVFGYDVCNRMGLLATEKVRELGLHGPGLLGGLAAVSAAGLLAKLTPDELHRAFSITASLSPLCPFINFIDGCDVKNIYGGWSVYLAMLSLDMVRHGLTGSDRVLDGPKSLGSIFASEKGKDIPPSRHSYSTDVVFKDYSACRSVHPALTAIAAIQKEETFAPDDICQVTISAYPYAYDLSVMVSEINPISARLSLSYTAAVMLYEGCLDPAAFSKDAMNNASYRALMKKITEERHEAYGSGPFGVRGSRVTILLRDGRVLEKEVCHAKWDKEVAPSDTELMEKFTRLTKDLLSKQQQEQFAREIFRLEELPSVEIFSRIFKNERQDVS
ncbi:MAG: MmgE/PrpD family protein [Angelakisella sp.]